MVSRLISLGILMLSISFPPAHAISIKNVQVGQKYIRSLNDSNRIVVSDDGQFLYTGAGPYSQGAIGVFRIEQDDTLRPVQEVLAGINSDFESRSVTTLALTNNGQRLLTISYVNDVPQARYSIALFERNLGTGVLMLVDELSGPEFGFDAMGQNPRLILSTDGSTVLVAGSDRVLRVSVSGADVLQLLGELQYGDENTAFVNSVLATTHVQDDTYILLSSNRLTVARLSSEGTLDRQQFFSAADLQTSNVNLRGAVVSNDGRHVYVVSDDDPIVFVLVRNDASGILNYSGNVSIPSEVESPDVLAISGAGDAVFVGSSLALAYARFVRAPGSGILTLAETVSSFSDFSLRYLDMTGMPGRSSVYALTFNDQIVLHSDENSVQPWAQQILLSQLDPIPEPGVRGLRGNEFRLSNDARDLYLVSFVDEWITWLSEGTDAGVYQYRDTYSSNAEGSEIEPFRLDLNSNGRLLAVADLGNGKVDVFRRNRNTGVLTADSVITADNNMAGIPSGLFFPRYVLFSSDGLHAYVNNALFGGILTSLDESPPGSLTPLFYDDIENGGDLSGGNGVFLLPEDGRHAYAFDTSEGRINILARDQETGLLTNVGAFDSGDNGILLNSGINEGAISPDGTRLYLTNLTENQIVGLTRDPQSGALSGGFLLQSGNATAPTFNAPDEVQVSPDGSRAVVNVDDGFLFFNIENDGTLSLSQTLRDPLRTNPVIGTVSDMHFSPSGESLLALVAPGESLVTIDMNGDPVTGNDIDGSWIGSWFNAERNGEGFVFDVLESGGQHTLVAYFFGYRADNSLGPLFLVGAGPIDEDGSAHLEMGITGGGTFGAEFDPDDITFESWGFMHFHMLNCRQITVSHDSPRFGQGTTLLTTLTPSPGDTNGYCSNGAAQSALPESLSGLPRQWFDPNRNGEGFIFDIVVVNGTPTVVAYWFTYSTSGDGEQLWLVGSGPLEGNVATITVASGQGTFFGLGFDPDEVELTPRGEITVTINGCNSITATYNLDEPLGTGERTVRPLTASPLGSVGGCAPTQN